VSNQTAPTPTRRRDRTSRPRLAKPAAAVALVGGLAGGLAGCGTAPSAAVVNGHSISVQQLDEQLKAWSSSSTYVTTFDAQMVQQAQQQAQQSGNSNVVVNRVQGSGTGAGVYGMYWTSVELTNMITAAAISQYLAHRHQAPTALQVATAWAAEYAQNPAEWEQLGPSVRSASALTDAEHALVDTTLSNASSDRAFYNSHKSFFWSQVCVATADVSVAGPGGSVDMAASRRQAAAVASSMAAPGQTAGNQAVSGAARYCLSPEQLLDQPVPFRSRVSKLAAGRTAVLPESYGYRAVLVTSRTGIPYSSSNADDIEISALHGGSQAPPTGDKKVIAILKAAKVQVNSAYGVWYPTVPAPYAPEVLPVNQAIR
jgi:hypothetical protein